MLILVDGEPVEPAAASVSLFDATVLRGDGCFEGMRVYQGRVFARDAHLDRLEASARQLHLQLPERTQLADWIDQVAATEQSALIRVVVTTGSRSPFPVPSRTFVYPEPLAPNPPGGLRVLLLDAPWHPAGLPWELAGVKSLSYGPNVAARREAERAGFDDALLIGRGGEVLEGPTWCTAWMRGGVLETPALSLGILASITRSAVIRVAADLGLEVREATFSASVLYEADEIFALATSKEVLPVVELSKYGPHATRSVGRGPIGVQLLAAFRGYVDRPTIAPVHHS